MTGFYCLAFQMIFSLQRYNIFSRENQLFETSTYLKLEMTLTYSSLFNSFAPWKAGADARGGNSRKIKPLDLSHIVIVWKIFQQSQEKLFVNLIKSILLDFQPKFSQTWCQDLMELFQSTFTIPGSPQARLFCCFLWFPPSLATLIYGRIERRWEDQRSSIWMTDLITWNNCRCSIRRKDRTLLALSQDASDTCL